MNHQLFFNRIRSTIFGSMSQENVDGINAILHVCKEQRMSDARHVACILANVHRETGGYMYPIKETVMPHHKNKNPPDSTVIARLNTAYNTGRLPGVRTPYWRDGWFGRGQIQITHEANYRKFSPIVGVDLIKNRHAALDLQTSAMIAVIGMRDGMFRAGNSLKRYFNDTANDPYGARQIVNGPDGTNEEVAGYHRKYLSALEDANWAEQFTRMPTPKPSPAPRQSMTLWAWIKSLFTRT